MLEGCGVMPTVHCPLILNWRQNEAQYGTVHYISVEHDIALLTPTLVACVPASSDQKSPDTTRHALDQGPGGRHCLVQLRWNPCLGSQLTFAPQNAQLGSCYDSELAIPWPQHPFGTKRLPCHVLYGVGHCYWLKVTSIHTRRPWQHLISQDLDVPMPVHGSIYNDQLSPPPCWIAPRTMTDGLRFPSLGWAQVSTPCLRHTWTSPSLRYRQNQDSSLKIQCLHCLRSSTLCLLPLSLRAASPVLQSEPRTSG